MGSGTEVLTFTTSSNAISDFTAAGIIVYDDSASTAYTSLSACQAYWLATQAAWHCESCCRLLCAAPVDGWQAGDTKSWAPTIGATRRGRRSTSLLFCCCSQWLNNTAAAVAPRCVTFGAAPLIVPSSWPLSNSTSWILGFLSGTSSYSTVVNTYTWNLPDQATQLGSSLSLVSCAQLCAASASCYAW